MEDRIIALERKYKKLEFLEKKHERLSKEFVEILKNFNSLEAIVKNLRLLDEEIIISNGKEKPIKIRGILEDVWKVTEPLRFTYLFFDFLQRHRVIKYIFWIINILFASSIVGITLTGKGFLQLLGIISK